MRHLLLVLTIMLLPGPFQGSAPGQGGNTPGASPGGILISPQGLIAQALATPEIGRAHV
mgnify:CR=1 FL=1